MNDNQYQYGWASILLHWSVAGLVLWLYWQGNQIEGAETREARLPMILAHNSVGVLLIVGALARTGLRLVKGMPARPKQFVVFEFLAATVPWALIALVLVLVASGVLVWWSVGQPLSVFGLVDFPSPLAASRALHEQMESVHVVAAHLTFALVILHVLGALKHLLIDRDGTFERMLRPARAKGGTVPRP